MCTNNATWVIYDNSASNPAAHYACDKHMRLMLSSSRDNVAFPVADNEKEEVCEYKDKKEDK